MSPLTLILAASMALILYPYVVYPLIVWVAASCTRKMAPPAVSDESLPQLSLLIVAYNEERHIAARLRNALAMDYPPDRLEIVIASDGSTDRTVELAKSVGGDRVRVLEYSVRRGKPAVLNDAFGMLSGEVILLSDANSFTDPAAARRLARWFADPDVGVACGKLALIDPATGRNVDGLYWKFETFLKSCEGRLGGLLGSNGAIYALRRGLFRPLPARTIIDDFVIPLRAVLETECRQVYDAEATAVEETPPAIRDEFRRRARIGAGGFQSLGVLWPLLHPRRGWLAFTFVSHKLLRWVCPLFMITAAVLSVVLVADPFGQVCLAAQSAGYMLAGLGAVVPGRSPAVRVLRLGTMFAGMNAALAVGFWRWLAGTQRATWSRTARAAAPADASVLAGVAR